MLYYLPVFLHGLMDVWRVFRRPAWSEDMAGVIGHAKKDAALQSFGHAADRVKSRVESILEHLYKHSAVLFIESFVKIFFIENPAALEYEPHPGPYNMLAMEMLSATPSSASHHVLSMLVDGIRQRTPGISVAHRRNLTYSPKL